MRIATPLGPMFLTADGDALVAAHFAGQMPMPRAFAAASRVEHDPLLARAAAALSRYFAGLPLDAGVPLMPHGTRFQQAVWAALRTIPSGESRTYAETARAIGAPRSVRAVGAAIGRNPIALFVPCHRVLGSRGELTGYAGGLARKRALLALEHGPVAAAA
jgi:methylated-DNA-[protein]-cysteine S-methyltransferase